MTWSRSPVRAIWFGATLAAFGCAQITGLTEDYRLGTAGSGGAAGTGTGGSTPIAGSFANGGGSAGQIHGQAGEAGTADTNGGNTSTAGAANGGATTAGSANGGTANGGNAGTATGGTANGGSAGTANGGSANGGNAGTATGGSGGGITRIGFSEFHDSASGTDQASSHLADASFAKPAGTVAGDFILVFFGCDHSLANLSGTDLSALGWTLIDQHQDYGTDGQGAYLFYKFADGSEHDPIVFTDINSAPSGDGVQGLLSVYRGVNRAQPVNAYETHVDLTGKEGVTHATTATPAITTTVANTLLIAGLSPDSAIDAPVITAWPDGFTENQVSVINPAHPYPYGWANIYSAERHFASAGTVAASSFGWDLVGDTRYFGSLAFVLALSPQ